ncbi:Retron-type RNA-directed DNA polymerase [Desulfovibrio sp. DV]|uniref:retron St85 family RNA-directed DNA polymerase n=1 Tax=Desulfovibrio sp. DV TaxID=1844708 RepID=UPI0009682D00|nr:retron St85 family RNA-directed DNA polymerase [Desulfovibrio sp. DV]OLN24937.1 Retron-type RNA-directed DNA polymerase [Desulfovibrio sp. DV]
MKTELSTQIYAWALGIMQPASATIVKHFMQMALPDSCQDLETKDVKVQFAKMLKLGLISQSSEKIDYVYSLTWLGNLSMNNKLRVHRDKARLFLLKDAAQAAHKERFSEGRGLELTGDSPVMDLSSDKQSRRPIGQVVDSADLAYWSSTFKQLKHSAGPLPRSSFSTSFGLYSFASCNELQLACHNICPNTFDLDISSISLCIGISPSLLVSMSNKPEDHYRTYEIGKKNGGTRIIHSPRIFLKTVQYWIKDYILHSLNIHDSCHAYQKNKSIQTNASMHLNKKFLANVDIKNFFGSISQEKLQNTLATRYSKKMSQCISRLCTINNLLPQGAPTSPVLSNFYLSEFDAKVETFCHHLQLDYTRYADDLTISGNYKDNVLKAIDFAKDTLNLYELKLNDSKTRVASKHGQQKVTGVVVNEKMQPPRKFRKKIRATFYQAKKILAIIPTRKKSCEDILVI